ncbi:MAG: M48 family metalloprotease [Desulfobacterales bacterium]
MKAFEWLFILWLILTCLGAAAEADEQFLPDPSKHDIQALMEAARADEKRLEQSDALYRDLKLEAYVNQVAMRLVATVPENDGGFMVKVIKDPHLNAFTYPDGFCYVNTGILARLENEAQLAALLAHEIAHYINHHAVNGIRRFQHQPDPAARDLAHNDRAPSTLAAQSVECTWSGYRHEAELEADREGLKLMIRAGYNPYEALRLFEHLAEEMAREKYHEPLFFGSHPRLQTRIEKCSEFLSSIDPTRGFRLNGENRFGFMLRNVILDNISLDIQAGRFAQARQASERFLATYSDDARVYYLLGEIYRQLGRDRDASNRAESFYKRAIDLDAGYPEPHRALGLMYYKAGQSQKAKAYLEASVFLAPTAQENTYIRNYLKRIHLRDQRQVQFAYKKK